MATFLTNQIARTEALYPIFSLTTNKVGLIKEFESILNMLELNYTVIELPGLLCPEVGFAIDLNQPAYLKLMDQEQAKMSKELYAQWNCWGFSPPITPLPGELELPDACLPKMSNFLKLSDTEFTGEVIKYIVLNTKTGEEGIVIKNYVAQEVTADPEELRHWKYFAVINAKILNK